MRLPLMLGNRNSASLTVPACRALFLTAALHCGVFRDGVTGMWILILAAFQE